MTRLTPEADSRHLQKRHRAEKRFRVMGMAAILAALAFLVMVLGIIGFQGSGAFQQTTMAITVDLTDVEADAIEAGDYFTKIRQGLRQNFPDISGRSQRKALYALISAGAEFTLRDQVLENPNMAGKSLEVWLPTSGDVDIYYKETGLKENSDPTNRLSDEQTGWLQTLAAEGKIKSRFNTDFLFASDSRNPEVAGIAGAVVGSFFTLGVCLILSFLVGTLAAIYLEEFAKKNKLTELIEVNINNLAAVPSIIFGLLGLAIFLNVFGLPRSASLVGGLVLALMTLPTIIIASRASLKSVPPSIREAALGLGASSVQTTFKSVVPLALPGMMTGTIIGMARALGETAPLLMIGMVAFIADIPSKITSPATTLPVQVFLWADSPERAFAEKTAGAIIVLLVFLVLMNLLAIILRKKYEIRW